jgi:hypothetical protein
MRKELFGWDYLRRNVCSILVGSADERKILEKSTHLSTELSPS